MPKYQYIYGMSKQHTTIHDNFIRSILADKVVAASYFENYLPSFVSEKLDFSTLTQIPDTYLSERLRKSMSDIVYTCQRKEGGEEVKVCLLIEHKSYVDKYTPVQIGGYIFSGLQKQLDNKEKLSIIIPVLLFHGNGRWEYQTLLDLYDHVDAEWNAFIPNFSYIYNNLGDIPDEAVEALNNKFLAASLLALKHTFQTDWLGFNILRMLVLAEEAPKNLQKSFAVYLFERSMLSGDLIEKLLESLPSVLKETIMSTADTFVEKGKKIGIEEGIKEGLEKGIEKGKADIIKSLLLNTDFTISKIAALTSVSEDFVLNIQTEIKNSK